MALHRPTTKLPASPLHFDRVCMSLLVMSCECPVCHAVVNPPTKMCLNGHLSCMGCVLDKPSCPECQERFTCARLSVVEQMLKIVGRACPYARHGCLTFLDSQRLLDHEPYCGWRRVQCLWCSSELGVNKWAEHVVKKHGFLALCYEAEGLMTIPISADHNKSLFYVNGVMFCMFIKFAGRRAGPLYLTFQCFPTSKEDMETVFETVARLEPKFLALHCQEVGGKNYEQSMKHVEYFVRLLMTSEELRLFDRVRVYLDEDYSSAENFTGSLSTLRSEEVCALGNFYFIHESVPDVLIWDFKELNFVAVEGKDVHSGNIEDVQTKEKSKFPQDFFPECKWSRKGFLRTRWNLNGTIFDLVNIHLFHDASNFIAMETFPSVYSKTRQRALEYTLDRFLTDQYGSAPFFLFGDFNFRTDMKGVIKKLANGLNPVEVNSTKNNEINKLLYRDEDQVILTLGKKEFSHYDHQNLFIKNAAEWLREFDKELECFAEQLFEFPIHFAPSYPYEEDTQSGRLYMQTRCPSWCDRVVLSETAKLLVHQIDDEKSVEYGSIGENTCMGDHKPVFLRLSLVGEAGRVVCCDNRPLLHVTPSLVEPSVAARRLERTDSSNSIKLKQSNNSNSVISIKDNDNSIVDFNIGLENIEMLPDFTKDKRDKLSFSRLSSEGNIGVDFAPVKAPGFRPLPEMKEPKVYERYIVKRVQSASFVEVPRVGLLRQGGCRCMSESQSWRARSVSISSRTTNNWRSNSRVRLISDSNLQNSLLRLQSHHSSSDEEWFEEISNDENTEESSGANKSHNSDSMEVSKIPVLEEISLEDPYEPIQSVEDISLGTFPLDVKTDLKCNSCCPIRCRKKRRLTKSQRNSIKSNISGIKDSLDNVSIENDRCCLIS